MPSLVAIYNKALAHVSASRIVDVTDRNNRAEVCNDMYEFALKSTLEAREWSFAVRRANLLQDTTATPPWGYNYAFRLPVNTIRVVECRDGRYNQNLAWEVEGDYLYSTRPNASVKLIYLVENTLKFSPNFVEMLAIKLAADICVTLTENRTLSAELQQRYERMIGEASALDGLQASRERLRSDRLINARNGSIIFDPFPYQDGTGVTEGEAPVIPPEITSPAGTISGPTSIQGGEDGIYTATVTGTQPITYQWQKDGVNIVGATAQTLVITSADSDDEGSYRCLFANRAGTSASNAISVVIGCVAPSCTVSGPNTVDEGRPFTFTANITGGNLPITFQWRLDGTDIPSANAQTYEQLVSTVGDQGMYDCLVSNACASNVPSSNSINFSVDVGAPPVIRITPSSASPIAPDTATFTCVIDEDGGDPAITFQWYLGGSQVGTNSNMYVTPATVAGQSLSVECVASNSKGDSNRPLAVVNPVSNLISTTSYTNNASPVLNAACVWVQAQGCGGGGGGGSADQPPPDNPNLGALSGGGGGGAALLSVLSSAANGGQTASIVVGAAGIGAQYNTADGGNGGNSSISGAGISGLSWTGGKGGESGETIAAFVPGIGGKGGNNSANIGGGAGASSGGGAGSDGTAGGGGGGASADLSGFNGDGGDGGGGNKGIGGAAAFTSDSGGGGGGGNDASWWDGAARGKGGDGGTNASLVGKVGTGNGNGGGGGNGTLVGPSGGGGGNGAAGRVILRQYRRQP
ncbi:tail tubular protein [Vibrio phage K227]